VLVLQMTTKMPPIVSRTACNPHSQLEITAQRAEAAVKWSNSF
jgi:hypothetical protein